LRNVAVLGLISISTIILEKNIYSSIDIGIEQQRKKQEANSITGLDQVLHFWRPRCFNGRRMGQSRTSSKHRRKHSKLTDTKSAGQ
jgi:hypothetical protein